MPVALASGVHAVTALPLRLRERVIGCLNLFLDTPGFPSSAQVQLAQALADVASIGILGWRTTDESRRVADQLRRALDSRVVIEQAKGVLMERHGVDMPQAFDAMRKHARDGNLKLTAVAAAVLTGELDTVASPLTVPGGRPDRR